MKYGKSSRQYLVGFCYLFIVTACVDARAETVGVEKAARGMAYAHFVAQSRKCGADVTKQAETLRNDIMNYYMLNMDDLAGKSNLAAAVSRGRANAVADARHPQEFCDKMDEVLSVWRSQVMPSPK